MTYRYDVFVSYAHADNQPLIPQQPGWVGSLVEKLRNVLAQKVPRDERGRASASIWMDPQLPGNRPFDRQIEEALEQSATLLIVHSAAYLTSDWCRRERETFLRALAARGESADGRVFVVEYDEAERPPELSLLPGYRFWSRGPDHRTARPLGFPVPTPDEREYFARLLDVAHEMAAQLEALGRGAPAGEGGPASGPAVYLAETTDDLDAQREEVRRHLQQAGYPVLPRTLYPRDEPEQFAAAARRDLAEARLFVQLLSPVAGRRPPTLPQGYAALQCELAEAARLPILQWRAREPDPETVENPHLKALLKRPTVQAVGLEEFKRNVVKTLHELRRPDPGPSARPVDAPKFVFINHDPSDRELAGNIRRVLERRRLGVSGMIDRGAPEEIRRFLEVNLLNCDGLIMVYGGTSPTWLMSQIHEYRKVTPQRDKAVRAWAVCDCPPEKDAELPFAFPNLKYIDCRRGFDAAALDEFIASLGEDEAP